MDRLDLRRESAKLDYLGKLRTQGRGPQNQQMARNNDMTTLSHRESGKPFLETTGRAFSFDRVIPHRVRLNGVVKFAGSRRIFRE